MQGIGRILAAIFIIIALVAVGGVVLHLFFSLLGFVIRLVIGVIVVGAIVGAIFYLKGMFSSPGA